MRPARYIVRRVLIALLTIFVAISMNFVLFRMVPGDFSTSRSSIPHASPELRDAIRKQFGLDKPLAEQYVIYLQQLARGNLGVSFVNQRPVFDNLWTAVWNTIPMVLVGLILASVLGIAAGTIAAWRRRTWIDHGIASTGLAFYAMPTQWVGLMLLVFFGGTLPSFGMSDPFAINPGFWAHLEDVATHMILPAATVALGAFGQYCLLSRSAVLDTLGEDYILGAKAKGLPPGLVLRRYALRNALLPITTLLALSLGTLVGGVILTETVFSWPGIGLATFKAIESRDFPMLEGAFLLLTVSVVFWNAVADVLYAKLDPRVVDEQ